MHLQGLLLFGIGFETGGGGSGSFRLGTKGLPTMGSNWLLIGVSISESSG